MRRLISVSLCLGALVLAVPGLAQHDEHGHADHDHAAADPGHGEHGAAHGAEHGGDHHVPSFHDINWFYGVLGEREGVEPSFIYRPKGMPAPFGAYLLNAAILYFILFRLFKKPVADGLKARKASILRGMDEAARMRKDAQARLADYEHKLEHIDDEIERVRREMREAGEAERTRVLAEAREQRARMERDARLLVEQELAAARETLTREMVTSAVQSSVRLLEERLAGDDHQRLADEFLEAMKQAPAAGRSVSPS